MSMKDYKHARRQKGNRVAIAAVALTVIAVIAAVVVLYPRGTTSSTVYCGILEYVIFQAQTYVNGAPVNTTATMTTAVDFTTTTTPGVIGRTYANSTSSVNSTSGYSAGVETICKYIASIST